MSRRGHAGNFTLLFTLKMSPLSFPLRTKRKGTRSERVAQTKEKKKDLTAEWGWLTCVGVTHWKKKQKKKKKCSVATATHTRQSKGRTWSQVRWNVTFVSRGAQKEEFSLQNESMKRTSEVSLRENRRRNVWNLKHRKSRSARFFFFPYFCVQGRSRKHLKI